MQRILIITENAQNAGPWQQQLIRAGYPVTCCRASRAELLEALSPRTAEILILDGTSCRLSPAELREMLARERPTHEPCVIWLISQETVAHLDPSCGIDDFIALPSSAHELLARVRLLQWKTRHVDARDLIVAGDLCIDQSNYTVTVNGSAMNLTFKEYELLRFLVSHRGRVFTREMLLNQVWGYDFFGGIRTVDVHIRRIRAKLGPDREEMVETVRNVGYRFNG